MRRTRENPEVHAGSMADIAFLLLIFFLVTTTIETDMGLDRKLPSDEIDNSIVINERNILRISLNRNDQILVEDELLPIANLKQKTIEFLDNGGGHSDSEYYCDYCRGGGSSDFSDNPQQAVISFSSDRDASYGTYVKIQDILTAAFQELRNRESVRLFGMNYTEMENRYYAPETNSEMKTVLKTKIETVRNMYPMNISEAELNVSSKK